VVGLAIEFLPIDPIRALFWSAVINGFVAVPIMVGMMMVVSRHARMRQFIARPVLVFTGWMATAVMGVAAAAMLIYR
jgi:Mn2+/Fe2+ NRAMP family transporter